MINRQLDKGGVRGVPKVIDFGVAKATQQQLTERTLFTEQGQLIGTPEYMSPEQAEMTALDVDTRTDIYSLGVLLYELLTGSLPFDPKSLRRAGFAEIQRIIREVDPPKPSTRLSALGSVPRVSSEPRPLGSGPDAPAGAKSPLPHGRGSDQGRVSDYSRVPDQGRGSDVGRGSAQDVAKRRGTEPRTLIRQLRGDLDWITMRALEKDRTRRYDTANALAMEIQRYLHDEPVLAGPPSASYRVSKFIRRNRGPVGAAAVVMLTIVIGLIGTTYGLKQAIQARNAEARQRRIAQENEQKASDEAQRADREAVAARAAERVADGRAREIEEQSYLANILILLR